MAWNDPENKNKNPWGNDKNQSELDDLIKKILASLKSLFGDKTMRSQGQWSAGNKDDHDGR